MNPLILIFIVLIGGMLLMTRSAKNKQRQALEMRNKMEPGTGIRTIGGMYAVVKEVNEETVLLELTDGVHAHFTKGAISTVLSEQEFNRIVHGIEPEDEDDAGTAEDADQAAGTGEDTADAGTGETAAADDDAQEPDEDRVELKKAAEDGSELGSSGSAK
ncbi:preprotein translocase subunit YajC [Actinacidiphila bryophytorum]|uniref:Preprotein translocase subunit YajC n=1 Tax=Actinacidiphila bryophytorum TaxID=1436133 RepID=A0A9W4MFJ5_9ACTN|nr:preprotein translocase subunit YajC [Actinacidiphila bryophytorum]MBM9439500.1 preprotein translocase subunit YajC [Actinacidiphila bryophytorum]MBN6547099.1 preprotein translocase subunit YajC [Actinacidiphila bryophytorum]CAG7655198.1 Preprotein translocase subunit YajC [Actinacidiphila bryophytorum]